MGFEYIQRIPSANAVLEEMPLSEDLQAIKARHDAQILDIFIRKSDRFLVIIGPCSADNEDSSFMRTSNLLYTRTST